jgi:hypothetical protein
LLWLPLIWIPLPIASAVEVSPGTESSKVTHAVVELTHSKIPSAAIHDPNTAGVFVGLTLTCECVVVIVVLSRYLCNTAYI